MKRELMAILMVLGVLILPACGNEPISQKQIGDPAIGTDEQSAIAYCPDPYWYCATPRAQGGAGGYAAVRNNSWNIFGPYAGDTCPAYNLGEDQETMHCNTAREWQMTSSYVPVPADWTSPCTTTGTGPWTLSIPTGSTYCAVSFTRSGSFYDGWDCTYPTGATFSNHLVNYPGYCDIGFVECAMNQGTWTQPPYYRTYGGPCLGTCNSPLVCEGAYSSAKCHAQYGTCNAHCSVGYEFCEIRNKCISATTGCCVENSANGCPPGELCKQGECV